MAYSKTYAQLQTSVGNWLNRSDLTSYLPDFINMAIRQLERGHNFKHMRVRYEQDITEDDYAFSNPIDNYKYLKSAHLYDSNSHRYKPLKRVSQEYATRQYPNYDDSKGRPLLISDIVSVETSLDPDAEPTKQWLIRPTADGSYTMEINAYQYTAALDGSTYTTNWWTENAWDVVLYESLLQAQPFIGDDDRINTWISFRDRALADLITSELDEDVSGSLLNVNLPYSQEPFDIDYVE